MKMMTCADRVALWNSQRYDQLYDCNLAFSLLLEETQELFQANKAIDKLDAIGDITFVAIGVFWKLGIPMEVINNIFEHDLDKMSMKECFLYMMDIEHSMFDYLDENTPGAYPGINLALYSVFIVALGALREMKMQHRFYDILHAICDSNQTKVIKGKTGPTVKANIDKGNSFVPPTDALRKIYIESMEGLN